MPRSGGDDLGRAADPEIRKEYPSASEASRVMPNTGDCEAHPVPSRTRSRWQRPLEAGCLHAPGPMRGPSRVRIEARHRLQYPTSRAVRSDPEERPSRRRPPRRPCRNTVPHRSDPEERPSRRRPPRRPCRNTVPHRSDPEERPSRRRPPRRPCRNTVPHRSDPEERPSRRRPPRRPCRNTVPHRRCRVAGATTSAGQQTRRSGRNTRARAKPRA